METIKIEKVKKLIPEMRFKGFDGEWKIKKLGNLGSIISGLTYSPKDIDENGTLVLRSSNVQNDALYLNDNVYVNVKPGTFNPVVINDILICVRNGSKRLIGKNTLITEEVKGVAFGAFMTVYRSEYNLFLLYFFSSKEYYKEIHKNLGATINSINGSDLKKFKVGFPSIPEQQKIASFLSAVDEKIQQLTHKKELLEQYKKGVMQQLFSGKLRFKDENGKDYADWDFVGGNELFDNISDKKHKSDLPILAITQDQGAIPRELINYEMSVTEASIASYKVVQIGDFVISLRTFQGGIEFSDYHGICSPAYNILRPNSENVDRTFYKFYLKTSSYIRQLQKNLEGIRDGKMISYKYFSEIKLPFPCLEEQQKIANFLTSIDSRIESTTRQITQTQTFKKGLLQKMFV
jgi:type I restriction enzyme S subunit